MAPRVVVHIGAAKCGSSAIQRFLRQNYGALREAGCLVPGSSLDIESEITGQQIWFFENLSASEERADVLKRRFGRLLSAMQEDGAHTLIVSAENICNHPDYAAMMREALPSVDVTVVMYVRRQDDYFLSAWQQWNLKCYPSLEAYLADAVGREADWLLLTLPWAEAFGDGNLIVRPFRRDALLQGDVVADFFARIGVPTDDMQPLSKLENRSFDEHFADMAHRVRDLFDGPHDNRFYDIMTELVGDHIFKNRSASHLLDLETRQAIYARYADANEALKRRFVPDLGDAPLFHPPTADNVAALSDKEKLRAENAILMRCVYHLAQRLKN